MSKRRMPEKMLSLLKEARASSAMERASFGNDKITTAEGIVMTADAFIKKRIELYMNSWVTSPVRRVIAWAENKTDDQ